MFAALRAASRKRFLSERSAVPPLRSGGSAAAPASAEGNCDDGMVSVSLGTPEPRHLTVRVEAHGRRRRLTQGGGDRLDLLGDSLSQRASPSGTVEDQGGLRVPPSQGA